MRTAVRLICRAKDIDIARHGHAVLHVAAARRLRALAGCHNACHKARERGKRRSEIFIDVAKRCAACASRMPRRYVNVMPIRRYATPLTMFCHASVII